MLTLGLAATLALGAESTRSAEQPENTGEKAVQAKKERVPVLPDFGKAYGLPFASIQTLGWRLTEARIKADPIGLALISSELAACERVSGKKADLTSEELLKEAVELVKMRRQEKELKAVALLIRDDAAVKELTALADIAAKEEAERITAFKMGERGKGFRFLKVTNDTDAHVRILANGHDLGEVAPYGTQTFHTPYLTNHGRVHLKAHAGTADLWRSEFVGGNHETYHWTLAP